MKKFRKQVNLSTNPNTLTCDFISRSTNIIILGGIGVSYQRILQAFSVVEEYLKRRQEFIKNLVEEKQLKAYFINSNVAIVVLSAILWGNHGTVSKRFADSL